MVNIYVHEISKFSCREVSSTVASGFPVPPKRRSDYSDIQITHLYIDIPNNKTKISNKLFRGFSHSLVATVTYYRIIIIFLSKNASDNLLPAPFILWNYTETGIVLLFVPLLPLLLLLLLFYLQFRPTVISKVVAVK